MCRPTVVVVVVSTLMLLAAAVAADRTADDLDVGDPCRITHSTEPGLCALLSQCARVAANPNRLPHTTCGFRGLEPIVCCPLVVDALPFRPPAAAAAAAADSQPSSSRADGEFAAEEEEEEPEEEAGSFPFPVQSPRRPPERVSATMCMEYHRMVHENITVERRADGTTVEHRETRCPPFSFPTVLSDRPDAKLWDYPHIALIGFRKNGSINWGCGGALISENFVLTAAHCIVARELGKPITVKLGAHNISRTALFADTPAAADVLDATIAQAIPHPEYLPPARRHDVALLRLRERVPLSRQVRPICLPTAEHDDTESGAVASAWGDTAHWGRAVTEVLLELELEQYTYAACAASASGRAQLGGLDRRTQLCANSYAEARGGCLADSGGPLQTYYSDSYQPCLRKLIGVMSSGETCGAADNPGVFTRVYPYLGWIESVVWPNGAGSIRRR